MEYKQNTRSPQYGKLIAYDSQGRVVKEFDMLRIMVEHQGVEYTVGQLLSLAHKHEGEVTILKDKVTNLELQNKEQDQKIMALEENLKSLVIAVQNLSVAIQGTEIITGE
jgi:hypothetical protein